MENDQELLGGYEELDFYLLDDTAGWPVVLNDQTSATVTHPSPVLKTLANFTDSGIDVNIAPKEGVDGTVYPIDIVVALSTRNQPLEDYLDSVANRPGIAIAKLNTGARKILGTNEQPLFLKWKIDDGKKIEDLGIITINIKGETRERPVYYTP